jgi:ubiquinone/menaquinone biosynthesis C-methylase UbiE
MPIFSSGARSIIELAALKKGEMVIDVACRSGIVACTASHKRLFNANLVVPLLDELHIRNVCVVHNYL